MFIVQLFNKILPPAALAVPLPNKENFVFTIPMFDFMAVISIAYGLSPLVEGYRLGWQRPVCTHHFDVAQGHSLGDGDTWDKRADNPAAQKAFVLALQSFGVPGARAEEVLTIALDDGSYLCHYLPDDEKTTASGAYQGGNLIGIVEIHYCPPWLPHNISTIAGEVYDEPGFRDALRIVLAQSGYPYNLSQLYVRHVVPRYFCDLASGTATPLHQERLDYRREEVTT